MKHALPRAGARRGQHGFTLIEIMVVVVILGILAAIVVPNIIDRPDAARVAKARQDIRAIESALKLYRLDNFRYPTTEQGLAALVDKPTSQPEPRNWKSGGYLDRIPTDPWGEVYHYRNPGEHGEIDVYTLGRDGRPGGEETDADIGNWTLDN
ncbi:general secretion pathway protein G [Salinisphaera orenii MK-B5]|uniref:Type II secretion system core protein G n=1 Tax=Salinisphaera orenii MK-B5 TaxID=856730 RepID=A0A423PXV2_9GAMM|nr:type II secretion system major pseudopilin GspG [Salinisphaera orenii]ROO30443.1 general secretion pathway protein G [Salinisphaera orenii MK-B5]